MPKFRLSQEDATRLDCPRDVEFDDNRLTGREAIALKKLTGWTIERLFALAGEPVLDHDGNQLWALDGEGNPQRDEAGQKIPLRAMDPEALLVMVWLAVRRAKGADVPWADFDINLLAVGNIPEDEPGKAPTNTPTKTATARSSTTSKSGTSRTRRR